MKDDKGDTRPAYQSSTEQGVENDIKRALTAGAGEIYRLEGENSSIVIGRAESLPIESDDDLDQDDYPDVPKGSSDYDTWLG